MNRLVSVYHTENEHVSLSLIQLKVLIFLNYRKKGAKFSEIQSWLERNKSQVSIILTTLKSKNLIFRKGQRPQINVITPKGREIAMNELKNVFKSTPLLDYFENILYRKEIVKLKKIQIEVKNNNRKDFTKINSLLVDALVDDFKNYLKYQLINKIDVIIKTRLKINQSAKITEKKINPRNEAKNMQFEEFAGQTEKIVKEELNESLERIPQEILDDLVRVIINKIHDKCFQYFK